MQNTDDHPLRHRVLLSKCFSSEKYKGG